MERDIRSFVGQLVPPIYRVNTVVIRYEHLSFPDGVLVTMKAQKKSKNNYREVYSKQSVHASSIMGSPDGCATDYVVFDIYHAFRKVKACVRYICARFFGWAELDRSRNLSAVISYITKKNM